MSLPASMPLNQVDSQTRNAYLQRVVLLTTGGLIGSGIIGFASAMAFATVPIFRYRLVTLAVIFGSFLMANTVASRFVFGGSKTLGFGMGILFQGIAMGYILLQALLLSSVTYGNPFLLIGEAMGLTALTTVGMTAYLWSNPKDFSMIGAGLAAMSLPMLLLMGVSWVFPIGGVWGMLLCAGFVVFSVVGLLYQINVVLHRLRTDQHVEGAYLVTMGVLVLFWNLLTLLMSFSRD